MAHRKRFPADTIPVYFRIAFFLHICLFTQRMAFEAIRASSFSFAKRQVEQALDFTVLMNMEGNKSYSAVVALCRAGRFVEWKASDPGLVLESVPCTSLIAYYREFH